MAAHGLEKDELTDPRTSAGAATPDGAADEPAYVLNHREHQAAFGAIEADIRHEITAGRVNDPNLDSALLGEAERALAKGDEKVELRLEDLIEDDSIYPEVRAAVSNVDDPTMKANTFRAWFMGMIACTVLSGINMYFSAQWPVITFPSIAVQLFAYPIGVAMSKIPYPRHWPLAEWVNPGPFNIKEHTMITIMSTVGVGSAYSTDIFITQHAYYRQSLAAGYMILLTLSTQLIGFSYAGFCRQVLVWPASMIWPSNLTSTAFLSSMHENNFVGAFCGWSRFKMFSVTAAIMFAWQIVPSYLFVGLSVFSWPTWAAPNNKGVNIVFGGSGGIGFNTISLDWMQVTAGLGSPLFVPWFAIANTLVGYIIVIAFVAPIMWATNTKFTGYLTFSSSGLYDRFGHKYSVEHVVTPEFTLDAAKYDSYSKEYLSATFIISYCLGFGAITASLRCVCHQFSFSQRHAALEHQPHQCWHRALTFMLTHRFFAQSCRMLLWSTNCPAIQTVAQGRARYPCASHGTIPGGALLVVRSHVFGLFWLCNSSHLLLQHAAANLVVHYFDPDERAVHHSYRNNHCRHSKRARPQRDRGDDRGVRASGQARRNDDFQDVWVHLHGAGRQLRF